MPADPVLAGELKSLQEEIAATQSDRREEAVRRTAAADGIGAAEMPSVQPTPAVSDIARDETGEELAMRNQLREFVDQVTQFFQDAEANIAAHPAESVIAALLVGILIGRLLGRG
jgi:signal transduction protein with GAF and PtsI domain